MYAFRVMLKDTFASKDLDLAINQLIHHCQGQLQCFADDRDLFVRVVGEFMHEFDLRPPTLRTSSLPGSGNTASSTDWFKTFWGEEFVGPADKDQWRDHDM